jgi:Domain of unknown function (DUF4157)
VQRRATSRQWPAAVPGVVDTVLATAGQPLESGPRTFMESRFHTDFSTVRVHADDTAARSAEAINASAYTAGSHLVFGRGQYQPHTQTGAHLLAHELSHVVQQRHMAPRRSDDLEIDPPDSPREHEAAHVASHVMAGGTGAAVSRHADRSDRSIVNRQPAATPTADPAASPAAKPPTTMPPRVVWSKDVIGDSIDLGRYTKSHHGYGDARLDRGPALDALGGGTPAPCALDLFLRMSFDFYLGAPAPGGVKERIAARDQTRKWPPATANAWKREYMRVAQDMWRTRFPLQPVSPCPGEPCTHVVGRLRVVDADTMTDMDGATVPREKLSDWAYQVTVYEYRSVVQAKDYSNVEGNQVTLYGEDVRPIGAAEPEEHKKKSPVWRPGGAPHETGHMLGRPHANCEPEEDQNAERCYDSPDVMGRGTDFSAADHAPFVAAMKALTRGCLWQVQSQAPAKKGGGLPWWAYLLIGLTGVGLIGLGIAALAGAL